MRLLYKLLLQLHPSTFRQRFATEMLWVFDRASESGEDHGLLLDGLISLGRQWLLLSEFWTLMTAVLVAGGQFMAAAWILSAWHHSARSALETHPAGAEWTGSVIALASLSIVALTSLTMTAVLISHTVAKTQHTGARSRRVISPRDARLGA